VNLVSEKLTPSRKSSRYLFSASTSELKLQGSNFVDSLKMIQLVQLSISSSDSEVIFKTFQFQQFTNDVKELSSK
jgi:hypothetical protein